MTVVAAQKLTAEVSFRGQAPPETIELSGYGTVFLCQTVRRGMDPRGYEQDEELSIRMVRETRRWRGVLDVRVQIMPSSEIARGSSWFARFADFAHLFVPIELGRFEQFSFEHPAERPSGSLTIRVTSPQLETQGGLPALTTDEVAVLELLRRARPEAYLSFTTKEVAERAGLSLYQAKRALRSLRRMGLTHHASGGGRSSDGTSYGPAHWYWLYPR